MTDDTESASGTAAGGGDAGAGAGGSQHSKPRHKRTRTGCLKCRIRRRKCDEGKPRCQRCIDGNFDCQYGPRLTFLNKNALTVSPSPRAPEAAATTPKYSRLQFVSPGASKQGAKEASPSSPAHKHQETTVAKNAPPPPPQPSAQTTPTVLTFQAHPQPLEPPTPKPNPIEPSIAPHQHPPPTQWRAPSLGHESLSSPVRNLDIAGKVNGALPVNDAAYETALNVLLSLGSEGANGLGQSPEHGSAAFTISTDGIGLSPRDLMSVSPNSARERRGSSVVHAPTSNGISQDRLLQLLRHFRYQVAPWLDLCDMGQTFGLYVPRLAIESERVLHALLAVAATVQQADLRIVSNDVEYLKSLAGHVSMELHGVQPISDGELVHLTLSIACRFIANIPNGWNELPITIGDRFWARTLAEASQKTISILSVLIRLELAAALVTGSPISVPEQLNYNPMSQQWNTSSPVAEKIFQNTIEPLLLCAQVVNFCAGSFPPQTPDLGAPPTPVHRWTMLNDALNAWYADRAQEFRPMVEIDGDENLFPTILFTNGAAVFANQLYHTAVLLLLQNKPRTLQAQAAAGKKSSSTSPLWHAQRVCGIALNNDRRDSWDLCLVASLYLAAQRMTYEPQQRAVLECFDRVKSLTGWNLDGFSAKVREDWGLM